MLLIAPAATLAFVALLALLARRRRPVTAAPEARLDRPTSQTKPRAAVLAEAVPAPATISGKVERPGIPSRAPVPAPPPVRSSRDAIDTLDALLAELESTTVRIDGADALDEGSVADLERLADRLEAAADAIAAR